jgi:hypothetical protein
MSRQPSPSAGELAARLRTSAAPPSRRESPPAQEPAAPAAPEAARAERRPRPRTIRYTIDFTPDEHRAIHLFAYDAGLDIKAVLRAFVRLLDRDATLTERIVDEARRQTHPEEPHL